MKLVLLALAILGYCFDINSGCCGKKNNGNSKGCCKSCRAGDDLGPGNGNKFDAEIIVRPDSVTIKCGGTEKKLNDDDKIKLNETKLVDGAYTGYTRAYKIDNDEKLMNAKVTVSDGGLKNTPYLIAIVSFKGDESSKYIVIVSKEDGSMESLFSKTNLTGVSLLSSNGITVMKDMFRECKDLTVCDINMNTSRVTNMSGIFYSCGALVSLPDISKLDTSNVTNMSRMFYRCLSLSSLPDISKWNTNNVTNMECIFQSCSSLISLPNISKWNTSNVTNMSYMFNGCSSLTSFPDINKWNTSNVTNMGYMFNGCEKLESLPDISKWSINKVTDMSSMFAGCSELRTLDLSKFKSNCSNVHGMFECCGVEKLDLSGFTFTTGADLGYLFDGASVKEIIFGKIQGSFTSDYIFHGCDHLVKVVFHDDLKDDNIETALKLCGLYDSGDHKTFLPKKKKK